MRLFSCAKIKQKKNPMNLMIHCEVNKNYTKIKNKKKKM